MATGVAIARLPGGAGEPDYLDFLYCAAVVGTTQHVSDVDVSSAPMRRPTLMHGIPALGFDLAALATAANVFTATLA